ncbi:MAG TPA: MG2 domain-containing protein, partial [Anaerolineaceae bacterium]|nr:MG2 domain-containing protein [Anaerolineaceae bacterium]
MKHNRVLGVIACAVMLALIGGMIGLTVHYAHLPERISQHETILLGQNRFVPGSQAAVRVLVRDSKDAAPLAGAAIQVLLRSEAGQEFDLFQGETDRAGTAEVAFQVPAEVQGKADLIVKTRSKLGSDELERPVSVERDYRVLLSSDKPIYQPGQIIHLRALALSTFDFQPAADQPLEFIIADGEGNKVFRETVTTSAYGVASVDFQLADEVNTGAYKITTQLGEMTSEKTVTVERYVLPKFSAKMQTERPFYLPGEHVQGSLQTTYFYGKPVSGGQVLLEGYTFDFERQVVVTLDGTTDEDGNFDFEFDLPNYLVGSDLDNGSGRFYLQATVTDLAAHTETANLSLPVAQNRLVIQAMPESGVFKPGLENIVYLMVSYPDGTPASADLNLVFDDTGQTLTAQTGEYGIAKVKYTPSNPYLSLTVTAQDAEGATASQQLWFEGNWAAESILLRTDRPIYKVGESVHVNLLSSRQEGRAYLDIVRDGQTLSTRSLSIAGGQGEAVIDLSPDLFGTLELHAYLVQTDGSIVRDTRLVVVEAATDLAVTLTPGRETYLPGDSAGLDVQVNGAQGEGVQSALGLAVVDEAVFALAEQDPGFAKLYFMLEQELLQPKIDLHGFTLPDLMGSQPVEDQTLLQAQNTAGQASLASALTSAAGFGLQANSHQDALSHAAELQAQFFTLWSKGLFGLALLIPLTALLLSGIAIRRERLLGRSLIVVLAIGWIFTLAVFLWPLGDEPQWIITPLERIGWLLDQVTYADEAVFGGLLIAGLISAIGLIVIAVRRKDGSLGLTLGMTVVYLVSLGALFYSITHSGIEVSENAILLGLLAYLLFGLTFLLRAVGFAWQKRPLAALAGAVMAVFLVAGLLPGLASTGGGLYSIGRTAMNGMVEDGVVMEEAAVMAGDLLKGMPMPMATQAAGAQAVEAPAAANQAASPAAPRLRQYFPETMVWLPDAVTDENGQLHVEFPVADSITTWRMTALASSQDGRLGSVDAPLRVFQDFFVDIDLPVSLTVGDEISIPIGVFNYLPEEQAVELTLEAGDWFEELDGQATQT